jgi:hypothetical protein
LRKPEGRDAGKEERHTHVKNAAIRPANRLGLLDRDQEFALTRDHLA